MEILVLSKGFRLYDIYIFNHTFPGMYISFSVLPNCPTWIREGNQIHLYLRTLLPLFLKADYS